MPRYFYTAKSFKGENKSGVIEARDERQLARILHKQGFVLISVNSEKEKGKERKIAISFFSRRRVSLTDMLFFIRNLQIMISAGFSLPRVLKVASSQIKGGFFKEALLDIMEEINRGKNFSESLAKYPDIFSELFVNMIKVGEESGTLDNVLKVLEHQLGKEHQLKSKIKEALIYPAVIVSAMILVGIMMLIVVVPQLAEIFKAFNIELPLTTRITIFLGTFLYQRWYIVLLIIIASVVLFKVAVKTKKGKRFIDGCVLKIPIISTLIKKTNSALTLRTLGSLILAGIPFIKSLEITAATLGNYYFKEAIANAVEEIKRGEKFSVYLERYQNLYSSIIIQMIAVGEETGATSTILIKLASFFEEEVNSATKSLISAIEPVLMIIIGVTVGFFAVSMIQPMYGMLEAL